MPRFKNLMFVSLLTVIPFYSLGQLNSKNMLLKEREFYINYEILPIQYKIELNILKFEKEFTSIIHNYNGKLIQRKIDSSKFDPEFIQRFPFYDFHGKAKLYKLSNGLIAVDQSLKNKSNPYFICNSIDDFNLVNMYLSIYFVEQYPTPIIKCSLYEHFAIKSFLQKEKLELIKEISDDRYKVFRALNGQIVYVSFNKNPSPGTLKNKNIAIDPKYKNEEEVYHSAAIYESLEIMYKLGELN